MERLKVIRKIVEDLLRRWIAEPESRPSGPVNWSDIGIQTLCKITEEHDDGNKNFYIKLLLDEAHPEANHFKQVITNALEKAGHIDVRVETEW